VPLVTVRIENLKEVQAELRSIASDQVPFATAMALTKTAQAGQGKIRSDVLPTKFILRRAAWMKNNIRVKSATKTELAAEVRDTYRAMVLQETGGIKIPFGSKLAVPLSAARPSESSLISPQNRPAAVMARGGFIQGNILYGVPSKRAHGPHKNRRGARGASSSGDIVPMYALVPRARIDQRYGFEDAVIQVVHETFGANFADAFKRAVRTAR
jgi:hypothetical protein